MFIPSGEADLYHLPQRFSIELMGQKRKFQFRGIAAEIPDAAQPRECQCDHGRPRRTVDTHAKLCHKKQIQRNVDHTGNQQKHQRRTAVAQSSQDARIEVVAHIAKNADGNNAQILHCIRHSIRGHLHQMQERRPQYKPQHRKRNGRCVEKKYGCSEQLLQCGLIGCAASL